MQDIIINIINKFGYFGVFFLITVENLFPPIPSEIILTFSGFATTVTTLKVFGVILSSTIGSVLGAWILYYLGRILDAERLEKIVSGKIGKALHFKISDIRMAEKWFGKYGKVTVFICRFIPIVRSLISVPAGMAKMNMGVFLLLTTLGTAIWNTVLVLLGRAAGENWDTISNYFDTYSSIFKVVFIVIFVLACGLFVYFRFIKKPKTD